MFFQFIAAQRHMVDRVHMRCNDGRIWHELIRMKHGVLPHNDGTSVANHAGVAGIQEDRAGLEPCQGLIDIATPESVSHDVDGFTLGA